MTISLYKIYECISLSNFAASSLVAPGIIWHKRYVILALLRHLIFFLMSKYNM